MLLERVGLFFFSSMNINLLIFNFNGFKCEKLAKFVVKVINNESTIYLCEKNEENVEGVTLQS